MPNEQEIWNQAFEDLKRTILKNTIITDGIISNVRESDVLCDVTISGTLFSNVPFHTLVMSKPSILAVPADKSPCLICLRNANFTTPQILFIQNVDKYLLTIGDTTFQATKDGIVYNEGTQGVPKASEIGKMIDMLNAIIGIINGSPIPEPGSSSPSALQAAIKTAISGLDMPTLATLQNNAIKQ